MSLVLAIPVFNGEAYLAETLQSLVAQGPNVRWWLQDGGSSDRTLQVARSFARTGDHICSEPDNGQADALNRAFASMGGEILGFINADDSLSTDTAKRVLEFFEGHPDIDLIYGSVEWMDAAGQTTGHHTGNIQTLSEMLDIYRVWWRDRQWVQPEVFFRRSLFERTRGFDPQLRLAFDYEFWVQCMSAGARVAHAPGVVARFRLHAAQKSSAAEEAANEIRAIVGKHLPGAAISRWKRRQIQADLDYDHYQLDRAKPAPFFSSLLKNPHWLLARRARQRIESNLGKRLGRRAHS